MAHVDPSLFVNPPDTPGGSGGAINLIIGGAQGTPTEPAPEPIDLSWLELDKVRDPEPSQAGARAKIALTSDPLILPQAVLDEAIYVPRIWESTAAREIRTLTNELNEIGRGQPLYFVP